VYSLSEISFEEGDTQFHQFPHLKNDLLKAVSLDIKEKLFLTGAKALGLISKFITRPLWRILEGKGHILDMNHHYQSLIEFLYKGA
jgi:hypothetical protein